MTDEKDKDRIDEKALFDLDLLQGLATILCFGGLLVSFMCGCTIAARFHDFKPLMLTLGSAFPVMAVWFIIQLITTTAMSIVGNLSEIRKKISRKSEKRD